MIQITLEMGYITWVMVGQLGNDMVNILIIWLVNRNINPVGQPECANYMMDTVHKNSFIINSSIIYLTFSFIFHVII